jgi:hypothetical protein
MEQLVEFYLKHSSVILPIAGAVGKSALDVLADRVRKWLESRPEDEERAVRIFGPDNKVVTVVKMGKEIRTSKGATSD